MPKIRKFHHYVNFFSAALWTQTNGPFLDGSLHPTSLTTRWFDSGVVPEMSAVSIVTREEGAVRVFLVKKEGVFEWIYTRFLGSSPPPRSD